ncbi:protein IQ-DOMAIN 32-like [Zingiber officinale]|uniref:protein IQ-DOMAIN 32-like n=1 Tax=Zingiber officinale TaxID=94328 RepID=UPI001C4DA52F|nr:protein IQ-DOMAIN 32-like [Zingiber officinale]
MGRSSTSCFKIIGCGAGDAIDDDELVVDETKALADKRRWSFRKRSSKHQVLNDSVISEPISVCSSKQSQEALTTNLHSSKYNLLENLPVQEKPVKMCPIPSDGVNSEAPSSLSNRILTPAISALNEPDLITLQAAIRGYLARKLLHKFKSVVKLQAVVRGHLVRRQAIGTLRCIIAIIRMQAFVKARHSRQLIGNIPTSRDAKFEGAKASSENSNKTAIKDLLSNSFARQLLEITPTTKIMYIKCVPSKSDSVWKWLERWMVITSPGVGQHEQNANSSNLEPETDDKVVDSEQEKEIPGTVFSVLSDAKLSSTQLSINDDSNSSATTENTENFELQTLVITSDDSIKWLPNDDVENLELRNEVFNTSTEDCTNTEMVNDSPASVSDSKALHPNLSSEILVDTVSDKLESTKDTSNHITESELSEPIEKEGKKSVNVSKRSSINTEIASPASVSDSKALQPNLSSEILVETVFDELECTKDGSNHTTESELSESIEREGKNSATVSKKSCSPAFIAAHSKFEELSLISTVARNASSGNLNVSKVKTESNNSQVESFTSNTEAILAENSMFHDSRIQAATSECGTISSTFDSLEKSENYGGKIVLEIGALEEQNHAEKTVNLPNLDSSVNNSTFNSDINEAKRPDGVEQTIADLDVSPSFLQVHQKASEPIISDLQSHLEETKQLRSPEGIGRTHASVPDPHGTPSSDISVSSSKSKKDHSKPTHRQRSHLAVKKSPSDPDNDSVGRNSTENLLKDAKNPKRRNSFGMAKMDLVDQEPRLINSSSLPGYMQATASARAKAHVSTSLKSSPDMLDNQSKKRHSLPIENGKQTLSPSQTQQIAKSNGVQPRNSAERWQR